MENLRERKTRRPIRGLAALGLAGVLGVGGCESMSDQQALGLLLGGVAPYGKDPRAAQSSAFLGQSLVTTDAAERSRSNIEQNVNVGSEGSHGYDGEHQVNNQSREELIDGGNRLHFANRFLGLERRSESQEIPIFEGVKDDFYEDEPIVIALEVPYDKKLGEYTDSINFKLRQIDTGELIFEGSETNSRHIKGEKGYVFYRSFQPGNLSPQTYEAIFEVVREVPRIIIYTSREELEQAKKRNKEYVGKYNGFFRVIDKD